MDDKYQLILDTAENFFAPGERCIYSSIIDKSVEDVMINHYGDEWKTKDFQAIYTHLRSNFNKDTYKNDVPYFYMLYYLPLNVPKVQIVISELFKKKELRGELKILDVGCAVGTTLFAVLDYIAILDNLCSLMGEEPIFNKISIDLVDASEDNIKALTQLLSYYKARISGFFDMSKIEIGEPKIHDITKPIELENSYDIIVLSNIINEIPVSKRLESIANLDEHLKDDGHLIIIEPADQNNTLHLGKLKLELVNLLNYTSVGPCGVCDSCSECWCFRREHSVSRGTLKYIDESFNFRVHRDFYNERLKWSYCVLGKYNEDDLDTFLGFGEQLYVVSREKNGIVDVCSVNDGTRSKLILNGNLVRGLKFGDLITIDDYEYDEDTNEITLYDDTNVEVERYHRSNERISYKNVAEKQLAFFLHRIWGFSGFREGQYQIIENVMKDINTLGILPTGAGKSICFQLPAMMKPGVSLVVSPLKSLMKDQIDNLSELGFDFVDYIDSSRTPEEKRILFNRFKRGNIKILYVSPERLQIKDYQEEIIQMMDDISMDYFIIDEAHCASEWGHDFRPSYLKLIDVVRKLNNPTIIAVTATASLRVKEDILDIFHLPEDSIIMSKSLDRPEISLSVVKAEYFEDKDEYLVDTVVNEVPDILGEEDIDSLHSRGSGIVFTIYANPTGRNTVPFGTNHINDLFVQNGIDSRIYHSQLEDEVRIDVQNKYKRDHFPLLVSTKGFGMGIDKPNIDYIVHSCYSPSLEAYYQEAGRAGRDGEHAHSVIIARDRHPECVQTNKKIGSNAPICANSWTCSFTSGMKCDYGMQAKFIEGEYPSASIMENDLTNFIDKLYSANKDRVTIFSRERYSSKDQKFLFYLQKEGLVKDYLVENYRNNGMFINVWLNERFSSLKKNDSINNIVTRLQNFKLQKYAMLASIWEYVDNKTMCRRQFLMNYFGENVEYQGGCGFCDIEGISENRAVQFTPDMRIEAIYDALHEMLTSDGFSYQDAYDLKMVGYKENIHEAMKIRAMRYLEDYPNNLTGLYFSGTITLNRDSSEVYGKNQVFNCIQILLSSGHEEAGILILREISLYAPEVAFEIIVNLDLEMTDIDLLEALLERIDNKLYRRYLRYSYMNYKTKEINKLFGRSAK